MVEVVEIQVDILQVKFAVWYSMLSCIFITAVEGASASALLGLSVREASLHISDLVEGVDVFSQLAHGLI